MEAYTFASHRALAVFSSDRGASSPNHHLLVSMLLVLPLA